MSTSSTEPCAAATEREWDVRCDRRSGDVHVLLRPGADAADELVAFAAASDLRARLDAGAFAAAAAKAERHASAFVPERWDAFAAALRAAGWDVDRPCLCAGVWRYKAGHRRAA